jgi:hypothetical protein
LRNPRSFEVAGVGLLEKQIPLLEQGRRELKNIAMAILAVASAPKTLNPTLDSGRWRRPPSLVRFTPTLPRGRHLRCSAQYSEAAAPPTTPRPADIPWSRELSNSVRLIGTVGTDVELRQLPSGATVAKGRLAVWKSATETTWYSRSDWCYEMLTFVPFPTFDHLCRSIGAAPCKKGVLLGGGSKCIWQAIRS